MSDCYWRNIEVPSQIVQASLNFGELDDQEIEPFCVLHFGQEALDDLRPMLNTHASRVADSSCPCIARESPPSEGRAAEHQVRVQIPASAHLDIGYRQRDLHGNHFYKENLVSRSVQVCALLYLRAEGSLPIPGTHMDNAIAKPRNASQEARVLTSR